MIKFRGIFLMMMAMVFATAMCFIMQGCSAIKTGRVETGIERAAEVIDVVCGTASIFADAGVDVPGAKQCATVMATANNFLASADYVAISDTLDCAKKYDLKSIEFVQCVDSVNGIALVAKKISERIK